MVVSCAQHVDLINLEPGTVSYLVPGTLVPVVISLSHNFLQHTFVPGSISLWWLSDTTGIMYLVLVLVVAMVVLPDAPKVGPMSIGPLGPYV